MKTSKFFFSTLIAASAMTATAWAETISLKNGVQTEQTVSDGVVGAGNTYSYNPGVDGEDKGGWIWLGNLGGIGNVSFGSQASPVAFSGSGLIGVRYQGGNAGVTYTFDLSNVDATGFSGEIMVVNAWDNDTNVKVSGESWANSTYVFAGASHDRWSSVGMGSIPALRSYGNADRGRDTLVLVGATTFSGIQGASRGLTVSNVSVNDREIIKAESAGTVLTLSGEGQSSFYGTVGSSSVDVGLNMTGAGTQVFGGTNYFSTVTVGSNATLDLSGATVSLSSAITNAGTLDLSGATVSLNSAITNTGTLDLSGATVSLNSAITNTGAVTVSDATVIDFCGAILTTDSGISFTVIDGGTISGWTDQTTSKLTYNGVNLSAAKGVSVSGGVVSVATEGKDLTWSGVSDTWNTSSQAWTDESATFSIFDNVTFGAENEANKTVKVAESVAVNNMTVGGGYTFYSETGPVKIAGNTLTVASGQVLAVGNGTSDKGVLLRFNDIQLSGTINYNVNQNKGADSWEKLTFAANDAVLHIVDNNNPDSGAGLVIKTLDAQGSGSVTATWGGRTDVETLTGAANFSVTSNSSEDMSFNIGDISGYSGTLTITNNTAKNLTVGIGASDKANASTANVTLKSGTLNIAGTEVALNTVKAHNGTLNISGTKTTLGELRFDENGSHNAKVVIGSGSEVSATTIHNSWGFNTLTVNGTLKAETMNLLSGTTNTITGSGRVSADTLTVGNVGNYVFNIDAKVGALLATFVSADRYASFNGTTEIGSITHTGGILTFNGAATVSDNYTGTNNVNTQVNVSSQASLAVDGDFILVNEMSSKNGTLNLSGDMSVGGTFWIARDGVGVANIESGGTLVVNALKFGTNQNNWTSSDPAEKSSTMNLKTGGVLVIGSGGIVSQGAMNTEILNLNGGTMGTSADSLNINLAGLTLTLGAGATSTINTGKYENGAFGTTGTTISISNALSGEGALEKIGLGTLTLSNGSNSYAGGTTISGGQLAVTTTGALGSGNVKVSGGQLSIGNGVEVSNAITIILGDAYNTTDGIAAITGAGSLAAGKAITLERGEEAALTLAAEAPQKYTYQIFDAESSSMVGNEWSFTLGSGWEGWDYSYDNTSGQLTLTIPEPSAFGLLAGVGALALVASRRRRSRR